MELYYLENALISDEYNVSFLLNQFSFVIGISLLRVQYSNIKKKFSPHFELHGENTFSITRRDLVLVITIVVSSIKLSSIVFFSKEI